MCLKLEDFVTVTMWMEGRVCSCRLWDLFGIPCFHVMETINYIHQTPKGYTSDYFSKYKFMECYSTNINPMNGSNMWPQTGYNKPLPHTAKRMLDRSTSKRMSHASEKESKFGSISRLKPPMTIRHGNCLESGHNQKGCINEKKRPNPMPPKENWEA